MRLRTLLMVALASFFMIGCSGLPQITNEELNRQLALSRRQSEQEKEDLRQQINQLKAQATEREVLQVRYETIERDSAVLVARVLALETERDGLRRDLGELQRVREEAATLATQAREAADRASAVERERDAVRRELQKFIDLGGIGVDVTPDGLRISMSDSILFDSGKDELKPEAQELLARIADVIKRSSAREIRVAGHTDTNPLRPGARFASNWELSAARALSVVHRLVEEQGIPGTRVVALGFGDNRPIASNDTPDGRSRNRRVEIYLVPEVNTAHR